MRHRITTATAAAAFAALAVLTTAPTPARAGERTQLTIGSWNRALRSASANAVTADNLGGGALTAARDLRLRPLPGVALWATASLLWGGADGAVFQTLTTEIGTLGVSAGARGVYQVSRRLSASGRLDLGAARASLRLTDQMDRSASDTGWGATATAAIGLDLLAIASRRLSLGVRAELGYVAASAPDLVATSNRDSADPDQIRLASSVSSLGHLDLGGRFFSLSLLSQF